MATMRRRSSASAAIPKSAIGKVGSALLDLPEKPREKLSLREAVSELHESITAALDRGYSYDEVVKILANQGVDITVASLKRYLAAARKESGVNSKGRRSSRTRSLKPLSDEPAEVLNVASANNNGASAKATGTKANSAKVAQSSTEATPKRRQSRTSSSRTSSAAKPTEKTPTRSRTAAKTKPTSKTTKTNSRSTASQRRQGKGKSA